MKTYLLFISSLMLSYSFFGQERTIFVGKNLGNCNNASYRVTPGVCNAGFLEFTVTAESGSSSAGNPAISITFPGDRSVEKTITTTKAPPVTMSSSSTSVPITFTDVLIDIDGTTNQSSSCVFRTNSCDAIDVQFVSGNCPTITTILKFLNPVLVVDPCNCNDPQNVYNSDGSVMLFHDVMTFAGSSGDAISCLNNCGAILDMGGAPLNFAGLTIPATESLDVDFWRIPGTYAQTDFTVGGISSILPAGTCDGTVCNNGIPTVSEWGLIVLSISLLIFGIVAQRQVKFRFSVE